LSFVVYYPFAASILRVVQEGSPEVGGSRILHHIGNKLPNKTASYPEEFEISRVTVKS
jgi:hypothetical protein